jgi:hypothetical protein
MVKNLSTRLTGTDMRGKAEPRRSVSTEADKSARLHSRTRNKAMVIRPACRAAVQSSEGLPPNRKGRRRIPMPLASPTSPAQVAVFSDRMKTTISATR